MSIFTVAFWRAAGERAIKSVAQGAILAGVGAVGFDVIEADWRTIGGAALGAGILSILTSVGSDALTSGAGPSLTDAEVLASEARPLYGDVHVNRGAVDVGTAVLIAVLVLLVLVILGVGIR